MGYGGLINAFSSGMVDGSRAGALMDATFAEQDDRVLEDDAREVTGFVEHLAASGNDFNKALSTPAGQQMAYKAIASNPAVREAFASNPGFEPVGMVQTPDGRYTFVGRGEDGGIKPLTSGGKAVTYDSQQLRALTAASAGRLGVHNTAQGQSDLDTVSQAGDIFDDLEKAGVAPAQELRGLAQQGQQFIEQGGIPRQKGGIPAIRAATKPAKAAEKEQVIPAAQKPAEKEQVIPALLKPAEKKPAAEEEQVIPASSKPADKKPAAEKEQVIPAAQEPAEKEQVIPAAQKPGEKEQAIPALLKPAEKKPAVEADLLKLGGKSFEDIRRLAVPTLSEQKADFAAARDERRAKQEAAYQKAFEEASMSRDIGAAARSTSDFIGRGIDGFRNYVTKPAASAVETGVQKLGGAVSDFARGFSGEKEQVIPAPQTQQQAPAKAPAPQTQQQAPAKAPAKAPAQQQQAPASAAQKAVQKERVSYKVVSSPEKLEQLDSALSEQITAEPPRVRVQNDNRALERLSKLGQGKKPNSAQLHAAYRLAKSGLLSPQALAMFTQTGKLDNTAFDNAYKEHNIRQGYAQLAQGDRRLSFDMFKEQREEGRSLRRQQVSFMKEVLRQRGVADKEAQEAAEKLDKKGRGMLTQTVASQFRQMYRYKDASDSVIKDEAETAVAYMLANPQYVGVMLDGRTTPASMPDFVVLSEGIPAMVNQTVGEDGFFSAKKILGHAFENFKNAQKSLTGE